MKTEFKTIPKKAVIEQIVNNTTTWIGHRSSDNEDVVSGQTFLATSEGELNEIEVFSTIVTKPGKVTMTLFDFDLNHNSWGKSLGSASVDINASKSGKWLAFSMPHLHLNKGKSYGFRLESADSYIGVGEAACSSASQSFNSGQEWQFTKKEKAGHCYSYFSLAYKVAISA
jgi:hypothetical protein